ISPCLLYPGDNAKLKDDWVLRLSLPAYSSPYLYSNSTHAIVQILHMHNHMHGLLQIVLRKENDSSLVLFMLEGMIQLATRVSRSSCEASLLLGCKGNRILNCNNQLCIEAKKKGLGS